MDHFSIDVILGSIYAQIVEDGHHTVDGVCTLVQTVVNETEGLKHLALWDVVGFGARFHVHTC